MSRRRKCTGDMGAVKPGFNKAIRLANKAIRLANKGERSTAQNLRNLRRQK